MFLHFRHCMTITNFKGVLKGNSLYVLADREIWQVLQNSFYMLRQMY